MHHTSQVDPVHRAENEAFGMEATAGGLKTRVKYMMILSAGLLVRLKTTSPGMNQSRRLPLTRVFALLQVGALVGATRLLFGRRRATSKPRSRSGKPSRSSRGATAALLSK